MTPMSNAAFILDPQQSLAGDVMERLRRAANAAASWAVVPRPSTSCAFLNRVRAARSRLKQLETLLAHLSTPRPKDDPRLAASNSVIADLRASLRLLRATITTIYDRPRRITQLPRIVLAERKDEPRVTAVANAYLRAVDGEFSIPTFHAFVRVLQEREQLTVDELLEASALLKYGLLESLLDLAESQLSSPESMTGSAFTVRLRSLRAIGNLDWEVLIEPLIAFDSLLLQDPAGVYGRMDSESRWLYRKRVAFIGRRSDCTESEVAKAALDLAQGGQARAASDAGMRSRMIHVGYYIVDKGFPLLAARVGFHPPFAWRVRQFILGRADDFYITGILLFTIFLIAAALFPVVPVVSRFIPLLIAIAVLLVPAMHAAVELINNVITSFFDPTPLPKLDFSKGIPADCATLVTVPSLLLNEKQVRELVNDLEVRFLGNRDPNLHYALLTDLPDSVSKPRENDTSSLVDLASKLIGELDSKYRTQKNGRFMFLHRRRIFNTRQGVWMGWERKRGKLLDLNKLLCGEFDAFPIKAGGVEVLRQIRYVLTLDSDTQLPRGAAARLTGAIAHPLNRAVIDPRLRIVTMGYGILQPRVGVTVGSTARSRLAAIYSGQTGFDMYTGAVSDAYQDLFGEGIFAGKGIYEVATLHAVLNHRFPRNALLSHDLIEGAYARAGLVTDIEVVDDYPSHYSAYSRRQHRWLRGDWQIAQWIFSRVPDEDGRWGPNPISDISRWKIFDNMRRSLVDPSLLILFVAGWLGLPGGPLYWTIVPLILLIFPALVQLGFSAGRTLANGHVGPIGGALAGFWRAAFIALLHLVFLAQMTFLTFDAIVRSLIRGFITGERLLEWETAAQAEHRSESRSAVDRYLGVMPLVAAGLAVLVWFAAPQRDAIFCAAPILLLWALASPVTAWLDRPPREMRRLECDDRDFLLLQGLRIWRYFAEFGTERHNYLVPDNVQEYEFHEAPRISPTNIGLLLNARQAACELGFLTTPEFVSLTHRSLATIARLDKFRGHLYNWYDTHTLQTLGGAPSGAPFVSSVDSGNFVASLYTLHAGVQELARRPLVVPQLFAGLRAHWRLLHNGRHTPAAIARLRVPGASAPLSAWTAWLPAAQAALAEVDGSQSDESRSAWWLGETRRRVDAILKLLHDFLPWTQPEYEPLRAVPQLGLDEKAGAMTVHDALLYAESLDARMARAWVELAENPALGELGERLREALPAAARNLRDLAASLRVIAQDAERFAEETEFDFLANPERQVLSIGYDAGTRRIMESCYDMLASEARIATFLAIARGDLPQQSWFKLSRDHAYAYGRFLLLSWTGTMFEYLMPALWMRSYPNTLVARTQAACVAVQRAFAAGLNIPWGISESGYAQRDDAGNYSYKAFGVPRAALSLEATAGPVISPYSTFLALGADADEAVANLRRMVALGWLGPYGFYEAADYIESPRTPVLVREWMAHHQGMSLLSLTNVLCDNVIQHWFHLNPLVQSVERILHEVPVSKSILRSQLYELAPVRAE